MNRAAWRECFDVLVMDCSEWSESYAMFGLPLGEQEGSVTSVPKEEPPVLRFDGQFIKYRACNLGCIGWSELWLERSVVVRWVEGIAKEWSEELLKEGLDELGSVGMGGGSVLKKFLVFCL